MDQHLDSHDQIVMALTGLAETMNEEMDANRMAGYMAILGNEEYELLSEALFRLVKQQRWFPRPSEILVEINIQIRERKARVKELAEPEITEQQRAKVMKDNVEFKKKMGW